MSKAITNSEFTSILSNHLFIFEKNPHVAISFSGGSDSLALLILMNQWIKRKGGVLTLIHFNHKLREKSFIEAEFTEELAIKFKVNFKILNWNGKKPKKSIMQKAREIRYEKMISFCTRNKIITIMTAHHYDDSLETYFMKKNRNPLTFGLSGIPFKNSQDDVQILRPFINIEKKRLIKTCQNNNLKWIEDPTNKNEIFERVRIRKFIGNLSLKKKSELDLEFKRVYEKNHIIEKRLVNFFIKNLNFRDYGQFVIEKKKLLNEPLSFQIFILKRLLVTCSGSIYPPKSSSIKIFLEKLSNSNQSKFSVHSCIIRNSLNNIEILREYQKVKNSNPKKVIIKKKKPFLWDNRFLISSILYDLNCYLFDDNIWLKLKKDFRFLKKSNEIDYEILKTLPILELNERIMIPFLTNHKEMLSTGISIIFKPKIPITKKNF